MALKTLEYLRGITPDDCRRLRARGILNSNQLMHAATLEIDRRRLATRSGVPADRLLELANQCALLEISGMERHLGVIRRLGMTDLKVLKRQEAADLHRRVVEAVGMSGAPRLGDVQYWISQARTCDVIEDLEPPAQRVSPSLIDGRPEYVRGAR